MGLSRTGVEKDFFDTEYMMKDGMLEKIAHSGRNTGAGARENKYSKGTIWG